MTNINYSETLHHVFTATIIHARACGFSVVGENTMIAMTKETTQLTLNVDFFGNLHVTLHALSPSVDEVMVVTTAIERMSTLKFLCPPGDLRDLHEGVYERVVSDLGGV